MPTAATESSPTTALAALAARATSDPEEPWLFYRRGWDWRWRSWSQVADQVARAAEVLADSEPAVALHPTQDPDAVALGLAVLAAGSLTLTLSPTVEREPDTASPTITACRSRLERWQPRTLDLETASGTLAFAAEAAPVSQQEIFADAARFDALLPPSEGRPILCVTPAIGAREFQVLLAWTALAGTAWVLEPEPGAFHETVLWARPSLVAATKAELSRLAAAMKDRKHRRYSRWQVAVDVGEQPITPVPSPAGGLPR